MCSSDLFGFLVDTRDEIAALKHREEMPPLKIDSLPDYIAALVGFMNDMANKSHLHTNDWHRTVSIDALGVSTTDFDLNKQTIQDLINSGTKATEEYFAWLDAATPETSKNKVAGS